MEHQWVAYDNPIDQFTEQSYRCSRCGFETYTMNFNGIIVRFNSPKEKYARYEYNCDEYIIKNIIE